MAIEFPILWGKNKDGKDGFVVSHVKQIYYDWKSKKMLSDKLDDMDEIITANADAIAERLVTNDALATALANYVTKSMMSGQQVNDANMVPTSALAYAMQQAITKNAGDISTLNGKLNNKSDVNYFNNIDTMKNVLNNMKDSNVAMYYMTTIITSIFFGVQSSSKGIVSKVSSDISPTGYVYDFFDFTSTQIFCSRYNPGTNVNSVYGCNMNGKIDYTIS